jgi:hypothetical protein
MVYKPGDLIKVNGDSEWYAEVIDENEDQQLEVFYINRTSENQWVWKYDEDWEVISKESVLEHVPFDKTNILSCYKKLGFRPLTEELFVKLDDEIPDDVLMPTGVFDHEEDDSEDDMGDFIVPDEEGEAFTPADPSIPFVQETHELIHKYNTWEPKDNKEKKLKVFVDDLAHKYKTQDDERQFMNGTSVDYDHPPLKKQKSEK